jgi:hypothetical protein
MIAILAIAAAIAFGVDEAPPPPDSGWTSNAAVVPDRTAVLLNVADSEARAAASMALVAAERLIEYRRAPMCNTSSPHKTTPLNGACPVAEGEAGLNDCGGDAPLEPMWARERPSANTETWSAWYRVDAGGCPADILPVFTGEDFRRLPLAPPVLILQPDREWVLVNKETIVMTERTEQTFRTELLGHGIDVVATPEKFTYDFGDDSKDLVTLSAGKSWPDHDTFHVYKQLGTVQITLTTSWKGQYRVDGTTQWRDVVGTAETSVTSAPFTVEERRSRLVSGLCTDIPKPDDCG